MSYEPEVLRRATERLKQRQQMRQATFEARREKGSGEAAGAQIPGKGEMTRVPHLFRISGHGERSR